MSNFYVYRHIRLDTNMPFYVGKGSKDRAHSHHNRNKYWQNIVTKHGYRVEIIMDKLSEKEAFEKELEFIKLYKSHNYCEANLLVGDQRTGCTWDDPERLKRASILWKINNPTKLGNIPWNKGRSLEYLVWNKGNIGGKSSEIAKKSWITKRQNGTDVPWNKGKSHTESHILKYVKSRGCKPFKAININTLETEWEGFIQTECIKFFGWNASSKGNINSCLKGNRNSHKGYRFEYI